VDTTARRGATGMHVPAHSPRTSGFRSRSGRQSACAVLASLVSRAESRCTVGLPAGLPAHAGHRSQSRTVTPNPRLPHACSGSRHARQTLTVLSGEWSQSACERGVRDGDHVARYRSAGDRQRRRGRGSSSGRQANASKALPLVAEDHTPLIRPSSTRACPPASCSQQPCAPLS